MQITRRPKSWQIWHAFSRYTGRIIRLMARFDETGSIP
jgi:hypothetical protein